MHLLVFLLTCWTVSISAVTAEYYDLRNASLYFENFIIEFEKTYRTEFDKEYRFLIFKENLVHINRLNENSPHAVYAISQFADLTAEEVHEYTGLQAIADEESCKVLYDDDIPDANAPPSWDWREFNAVTRVKNQGSCGSCWTFSATGHLEGQLAIKHKRLVELSEQQLLDCDRISDACCGGDPSSAFLAVIKTGGMMTEKDYPYLTKRRSCRTDRKKVVVQVTDCRTYNLRSQEKVKQLLYQLGPISIAIRATAVLHYHSGVITDGECSVGELDHTVLLVGYGKDASGPYWIVKNSWGLSAGEAGYFRMHRSENPNGACGMLNPSMSSAIIA